MILFSIILVFGRKLLRQISEGMSFVSGAS